MILLICDCFNRNNKEKWRTACDRRPKADIEEEEKEAAKSIIV